MGAFLNVVHTHLGLCWNVFDLQRLAMISQWFTEVSIPLLGIKVYVAVAVICFSIEFEGGRENILSTKPNTNKVNFQNLKNKFLETWVISAAFVLPKESGNLLPACDVVL